MENGYKNITADEAKALMDSEKEFYLVDVRDKGEYDLGHIKGAVLLPLDEIEETARLRLPDKERLILSYCRSGARSELACAVLCGMGYKNIRNFGGILDWKYDIEK